MRWQTLRKPLLIGLTAGLVFGCVDLLLTWRDPLEDDSPLVLLRFYGPMFLVWSFIAFKAARSAGRLGSGVFTGMVLAFATFAVFIALNFLRVNLFLYDLTGRPDWQNMMMRFRASGAEDLRPFVNLDYVRENPSRLRRLQRSAPCSAVLVECSAGWREHEQARELPNIQMEPTRPLSPAIMSPRRAAHLAR